MIKEIEDRIDKLLMDKGFKKEWDMIYTSLSKDWGEQFAIKVLKFYLIALIVSEVGEYVNAVKKGLGARDEHEEWADIFIRLMNIPILDKFDAEKVVNDKMDKNEKRPYMYGTPQEKKE
ncbi:MazG nucleotide pyrophosphohydrolase domain-containing protein [Caldanaerobius polysaccharolyticus]|uniref:MazG nucleotide pyrophosphohydrolase domain-containing protein n=1 Tax=Caldanaerobius polysaccharolyticus TaxID=44256 RepID=UPI00047E669F|nr:MazG nucleotide pyrophosphohydrolase domain-containing protein [Caldanaerobius polysaccharolyticus]